MYVCVVYPERFSLHSECFGSFLAPCTPGSRLNSGTSSHLEATSIEQVYKSKYKLGTLFYSKSAAVKEWMESINQ